MKLSRFGSGNIYKFLCALLFIGVFIRPAMLVFETRDTFLSRGFMKQFPSYEKAYYSSQYMNKINPGPIADETFESFVGGTFLRGTNPILIVHEHPPLGRYIIALSIALFDNPRTIIVPLMAIAFLGLFLISKTILKNTLLALLPLTVFVNEPLVINKLIYVPLLEAIQLPFIVFSLYFFIKGISEKRYTAWFCLASVMLGFVISIRFFILGAFLLAGMICFFILTKQWGKKMLTFFTTLPLALVVLILSYTKTMQNGYSILEVLKIQKYIFVYHQSQTINRFSFWDLILFNRWHTWWGNWGISHDSNWVIFWPISIVCTAILLFLWVKKYVVLTQEQKIVLLWVIFYCVLLSSGMATTRYFLPLVPFLYIASVLLFVLVYKRITKKRV